MVIFCCSFPGYFLIVSTGYGFGTITLTWGRFLRYVQLQIPYANFDSFAVCLHDHFKRISIQVDFFIDWLLDCDCSHLSHAH